MYLFQSLELISYQNVLLNIEETKQFCLELFIDEPFHIFEHNYLHVVTNLTYNGETFIVRGQNWMGIVTIDNNSNEFIIFSPKFILEPGLTLDKIRNVLKENNRKIRIKNVSLSWINKYNLKESNLKLVIRSKKEAIYDVDLLTKLSGKDFANLRNTRNYYISKNKLSFKKTEETNKKDLEKIIETWKQAQFHKYTKNRFQKEAHVYNQTIKYLSQEQDIVFQLCYFEEYPVGFFLFFKNPTDKNGVIYALKGINNVSLGGKHGITDAIYLHVFSLAKNYGILKLNDGELGEFGTAQHKMTFKPSQFLSSFDLIE